MSEAAKLDPPTRPVVITNHKSHRFSRGGILEQIGCEEICGYLDDGDEGEYMVITEAVDTLEPYSPDIPVPDDENFKRLCFKKHPYAPSLNTVN